MMWHGIDQLFFFNIIQSVSAALAAALCGVVLALARYIIQQYMSASVLSSSSFLPEFTTPIKRRYNQNHDCGRCFAFRFGLSLGDICIILPFFIPTILSIFSLLSLTSLVNFRGIDAIILTHIYLNIPLGFLITKMALSSVPVQYWRLYNAGYVGFFIVIRPFIFMAFCLSFCFIALICLCSFSTSFILGGANIFYRSFEVMIYNALKHDLNLLKALFYAGCQLLLVIIIFAVLYIMKACMQKQYGKGIFTLIKGDGRVGLPQNQKPFMAQGPQHFPSGSVFLSMGFYLLCACLYFTILSQPFWAFMHDSGFLSLVWPHKMDPYILTGFLASLYSSIGFVLATGMAAAALWVVLGFFIYRRSIGAKHMGPFRLLPYISYFPYIFSPLILLYLSLLLVYAVARFITGLNPWDIAWGLVLFLHLMMVMPILYTWFIHPSIQKWGPYLKLLQQYHISGLGSFYKIICRPFMAGQIWFCIIVCGLISIGEFSVVAFLGSDQPLTLPFFMADLMQHYQFHEANWTACWLQIFYVILFVTIFYKNGVIQSEGRVC
jgi:ABC-type Fe3+ transport system permease subunit